MTLKSKADEVLNLIRDGRYQSATGTVHLRREIDHALASTKLYRPGDFDKLHSQPQSKSGAVSVVEGTTQEIAFKYCQGDSRVALLNFASARNPGGGFLNGAKAQEEDLCRCSALYPTLTSQMEYYEANRRQSSLLYTDHLIYSPAVPFFRVSGSGKFLDEPFLVDVITAPAPNSGPYLKKTKKVGRLESCFLDRWRNVLKVATHEQVETLILGAWGCGAFGGDPEMASRTALQAIREFGGGLEKILFAIPNRGKRSAANYKVFRRVLG